MNYATLSANGYTFSNDMYRVKINDVIFSENTDEKIALINFRYALRRNDLKADTVVSLYDDDSHVKSSKLSADAGICDTSVNEVFLNFVNQNGISIDAIKTAVKKSGLQVSNSKIGGWLSQPTNRKYQHMQLDELNIMLSALVSVDTHTDKISTPPPVCGEIKRIRESFGTQKQCAACAGFANTQAWQKYESGEKLPPAKTWGYFLLNAGLHPEYKIIRK